MLLEFRVRNFGCFRDEQVMSLISSKDSTLPQNTITESSLSELSILKSAVIYGANASGKTTFLDAMAYARGIILTSARSDPEEDILFNPFMLDEYSKSNSTLIEFTFIQEYIRYQYGFEIDKDGVLEEWLISYPKRRPRKLFQRGRSDNGKSEYSFSSHLKGEKEKLKELTGVNTLFLSIGATFNNVQLKLVYKWFNECITGIQAGRIRNRKRFNNFTLERLKEKERKELINELLKVADLGIDGFSIKESKKKLTDDIGEDAPEKLVIAYKAIEELYEDLPPEALREFDISMFHIVGDEKVEFPFMIESDGTQQLFYLSEPIIDSLLNGKCIFVDEIESSLHPLLVKELVGLFHNPSLNNKGAQIIFNTHDISLLYISLFRRDQVWFVEKDKNGASHLYSLLEYSPRKDEAIGKGYLLGRYGAIPFIGEFPEEEFGIG